MKIVEVRENLSKRKTRGKRCGKLISDHISEFFYPLVEHSNDYIYILTDINEILEIIDKFQKKKVDMLSKLLISKLLNALNYQAQLIIDA